jgi:hypothetical protein
MHKQKPSDFDNLNKTAFFFSSLIQAINKWLNKYCIPDICPRKNTAIKKLKYDLLTTKLSIPVTNLPSDCVNFVKQW